MNSRLSILLILLLVSSCQGLDGTLKNFKKGLHPIMKTLQPDITNKCRSVIIYEEVIPPTIIESDEPTHIILQNLTTDIAQAEIMDTEADYDETEEGLRVKRRPGRVVIRVCNRRRRRRCRYVVVVRRRGRRRRNFE